MSLQTDVQKAPTDDEIMEIIGLSVTSSTGQLCDRLRDLFDGHDYFAYPRVLPKTLENMQEEIYEVNVANGWYDSERSFGDGIALMHSEVSEAYEAYRLWGVEDATERDHHNALDGIMPKPEGVGSELADVFIRLLDESRRQSIDLRAEYERKIAYNRTRGYKHGGKSV